MITLVNAKRWFDSRWYVENNKRRKDPKKKPAQIVVALDAW